MVYRRGNSRDQQKHNEVTKAYRLRLRQAGAVRQSYISTTDKEYQRLLQEQHGLCAICESPPKHDRLCADHDHTTGVIRGLLCRNCNAMLGLAWDTALILRRGADYLELSRPQSRLSIEPDIVYRESL